MATIIGDDSGSRFYWALVDPGLTDSADLSLHEYEGTGSFIGSFSCEPENTADNLAIVQDVLRQVQEKGVTEEELNQAKSKIASRLVRASERPARRMNSVGMSWTYLRKYRSLDDELTDFERVTPQSIREVLDRYPLEAVTTLAYGPLSSL
jgi:predicted Zn-dependent peptidase